MKFWEIFLIMVLVNSLPGSGWKECENKMVSEVRTGYSNERGYLKIFKKIYFDSKAASQGDIEKVLENCNLVVMYFRYPIYKQKWVRIYKRPNKKKRLIGGALILGGLGTSFIISPLIAPANPNPASSEDYESVKRARMVFGIGLGVALLGGIYDLFFACDHREEYYEKTVEKKQVGIPFPDKEIVVEWEGGKKVYKTDERGKVVISAAEFSNEKGDVKLHIYAKDDPQASLDYRIPGYILRHLNLILNEKQNN